MNATAFLALARRDIRLFFQDRRAVAMSFLAPILIGSFFGYIFGGVSRSEASKIKVIAVDRDSSDISREIVAALASDSALEVTRAGLEDARRSVRAGKQAIAVVIPEAFGDRAAQAMLRAESRPEIGLLYDPSHNPELQMVRGI